MTLPLRVALFFLLLALIASAYALQGCKSNVPEIEGVTYWVSTNCQKDHPRGYWWPGKICYDGSDEVKEHENCHELAYRRGMSMSENRDYCHGGQH